MPLPIILDPRDNTRLASITEAAKLMGVSRRTIYLWAQQGKIEVRITAGGQRRVVVNDLMKADDHEG